MFLVGLLLKLHIVEKSEEDTLGVLLVLILMAVLVAVACLIALEVAIIRAMLKRKTQIAEAKRAIEQYITKGADFEDIYQAGDRWLNLLTMPLPFGERRPVEPQLQRGVAE